MPSLKDNLISHYKLEEASGTRVDAHTVNNNDLTDENTVTQATGKIDNAAQFNDALSEALTISDASQSGLDITGDFTIAMWIKLDVLETNQGLTGKWNNVANQRAFIISATNTVVRMLISANGSNSTSAEVTHALSTTAFEFLVAQYDASAGQFELFIDNVSKGTATGLFTSINSGTGEFKIGESDDTNFIDGIIDEYSIWDRLITTSEISEIFNGGSGLPFDDWPDLSINVSDTVTITALVPLEYRDTVHLQELVTVELDEIDLSINVNDTVTVTDEDEQTGQLIINVNDSITVAEAVTVGRVFTLSVNDTVTVAEDVTVSIPEGNISVSDTITITEGITPTPILNISVNDTVTATDVVTLVDVQNSVSVSDTATIVENILVDATAIFIGVDALTKKAIVIETENYTLSVGEDMSINEGLS